MVIFADDNAALTFVVVLCRVGEVLFRDATLDPELSLLGKLGRGRTTTQRIEHLCKVLGGILGPCSKLFSYYGNHAKDKSKHTEINDVALKLVSNLFLSS